MTARFIVGDSLTVLRAMPDASVDFLMTSPPFLALRSYLPADHPDKAEEIGSEATPAEFIDVLLELSAEWRRVLAPHGSIAVELGDTYSGSGGAGGDYAENGLREGQQKFKRTSGRDQWEADHPIQGRRTQPVPTVGPGWPLPKSMTLVPEAYRFALAYGINPHTGQPSPAGRWRLRNVIRWCRPNPPVGALGDKWRPATSDIAVACMSDKRYWDGDATRVPAATGDRVMHQTTPIQRPTKVRGPSDLEHDRMQANNPAGAPLLDYWVIVPKGYDGFTATTHRESCGPHDGGQRTTSPDCPVHADLPGQLPRALRDERVGTSETRTPRTDSRHEQAQLDGFATGAESCIRSGSSHAPTSPPSDHEGSPAATARSKSSSRTAHGPETPPPGTPFAGTVDRSDGTPASPSSAALSPDTSPSRTEADGSAGSPSSRTADDTADTHSGPAESSACTCSFYRLVTKSTSHYAVYPPELCVAPIEAMCPRRVCLTCGAPSRRETSEPTYVNARSGQAVDKASWIDGGERLTQGGIGRDSGSLRSATTTGWSTCGCPGTDGLRLDGYHTGTGWRPGIVLDCFAGTGTTLAVATGHGRDAIGIDLDPRNADLALERVGPLLLTVEHHQREDVA